MLSFFCYFLPFFLGYSHQKIYMKKNLSDFMIIALICAGNIESYYENIYIIGRAVISQRP